ncbi:hypothetical protein PR048_018546 [Dryococelus australis]|uniref:Uncharacterized protein n=1 Tax=Dryococelus australis TaxID=614101 RepID=A0ABQ9HCM2_9NEOP|nr:hypothetical protein PR048_018546 [Dryococelus australis]
MKTNTSRVLVKIRGKEYYALLDMGCSRSCIAQTIVANQQMQPVEKTFMLVGTTEDIESPRQISKESAGKVIHEYHDWFTNNILELTETKIYQIKVYLTTHSQYTLGHVALVPKYGNS